MSYVSPLDSNFLWQGRGRLLFKPEDAAAFFDLGLVNAFTVQVEVDEQDIYSSNFPVRTKIATLTNEINPTAGFTTLTVSRQALALAVMGLEQVANSPADTHSANIAGGAVIGAIHDLSAVAESIDESEDIEVTSGATPLVKDVHFRVIAAGQAMIEIIALPAGVVSGAALAVAWTSRAVSGSRIGVASTSGVRGHLVFLSTEAGREPVRVDLWNVQIRPDGEVGFIGETDPIELSFTASIQIDGSKPAGFQLGQVLRG